MQNFIDDMKALNLQKRIAGVVGSGTWAPQSGPSMISQLDEMKEITVLNEQMTILSALNENTYAELSDLADSLIESMSLVK